MTGPINGSYRLSEFMNTLGGFCDIEFLAADFSTIFRAFHHIFLFRSIHTI